MKRIRRIIMWMRLRLTRKPLTYEYFTHPYTYFDPEGRQMLRYDKGKESFLANWRKDDYEC